MKNSIRKGWDFLVGSISYICLILFVSQIFVVFFSWLLPSLSPSLNVRSLLSEDGMRWYFTHAVDTLLNPFPVWLFLVSLTVGAIRTSGFLDALRHLSELSIREKFAFQVVIFEAFLVVTGMALLTLLPHAPLQSVTGSLFPSSFSRSLIPVTCISISFFAISYGLVSGKMHTIPEAYRCLCTGGTIFTPLAILYILGIHLYALIDYAIG